jgi:hypothetical protein
VLRVKRGAVGRIEDVLAEISTVQAEVEERLDRGLTPLPADPDLDAVSQWSASAHRRYWGWD